MFRSVALIALAGCGRVGFDTVADGDGGPGDGRLFDMPSDVVSLGHDEDGDGIPDIDDPCPHLAGDAADSDGDGVGDLCDPNPGTPGDAIAAFYTMSPGDQPFTVASGDDTVWIQHDDSYEAAGDQGGDNNLFGHLSYPLIAGSVRVTMGMDVTDLLPVGGGTQNQITLAAHDAPPFYFVEMLQIPASFARSQITLFDGTNFVANDLQNLATGMHTGALTFDTIQRVDTGVVFTSGWPGEEYTSQVSDTVYQGSTTLELNMNNVHFEIRYLIVITMP